MFRCMPSRKQRVTGHHDFERLVVAGFLGDGTTGPVGDVFVSRISRSTGLPESFVKSVAQERWTKRRGHRATPIGPTKRANQSKHQTVQPVGRSTGGFAAVDFETATPSRASACAVGVVLVDGDAVVQREERLIQPPNNEYAPFNVSIHGISAADTATSGTFDDVWPEIADIIADRLVIAHNAAFDISVLRRSARDRGYDVPPIHFACSLRIARETCSAPR